jgi:Cu/Ag efflux protein CusF
MVRLIGRELLRQRKYQFRRRMMVNSKSIFFGSFFIVVSGCAAYELPPLAINHPANTQAMVAPERSVSRTLAYSRADMPAVAFARAQQSDQPSQQPAGEATGQKTVVGEGKVIATVPSASQVVVEHGEIKGFMDAMTMGYRVQPSSLLEGLKAGDQVRFTIDVPNNMIVKIEKMK